MNDNITAMLGTPVATRKPLHFTEAEGTVWLVSTDGTELPVGHAVANTIAVHRREQGLPALPWV